jgi:hypothetical protein
MSISLTTLKGTSSISADRITINNNFNILQDSTNDILGIVNTTTGKIDNTGVGADSTITTEGLTITKTAGLEVANGNVNIGLGNIILGEDESSIRFGATAKIQHQQAASIGGNAPYNVLDASEGFNLVSVPSLSTTQINDVTVGATSHYIVFDSTSEEFKGYNGTAWIVLG